MVTPTYAGDRDRLRLLLESRLRVGVEIPHVVVSDTEDVDFVKAAVPPGSATVITTAECLPAHIERRRRRHFRRRDPRRWAIGKPIVGWTAQQLVKLAFAATADAEIVVCVDSDVAFVRPVTAADFVEPDGTAKLFQSFDDNAEIVAWAVHAMEFLGIALQGTPVRGYIHNPVVLRRDVVAALVTHVSKLHRGHWMDAVMRSGSTEYQLYGVFAAHLDAPPRVTRTPPLAAVNFWVPESGDVLKDLYGRVKATDAKVVGIQSSLSIPPDTYRPILEQIWNEADGGSTTAAG